MHFSLHLYFYIYMDSQTLRFFGPLHGFMHTFSVTFRSENVLRPDVPFNSLFRVRSVGAEKVLMWKKGIVVLFFCVWMSS